MVMIDRRALIRGAAAIAGAVAFSSALMRSDAVLARPAAATDLSAFPESVYSGKEYSFTGPATISGGLARITLQNDGTMDHHLMLLKFNDGKSMADLQSAMQQGLAGLATLGSAVGGPGTVGAGQKSTVIIDLAAGDYVAMCLIPDDDGIPHAAKGMVLPISVTAPTATPAAAQPTADATIELTEYHFNGLPQTVTAGQGVWQVTNTGQQLHEMGIAKLAPGVTFDQVQAILSSSPATPMPGMPGMGTPAVGATDMSNPEATGAPFVSVGGAAPMQPGAAVWVAADFAAGDYFAICFVPDNGTGAPHFALGMIAPFSVS
jgi:hypothetical protein